MAFAPRTVIEAPSRLPLPYGLFSVVSLAEAATERWENGVTWEALTCDPIAVVVGDCDAPEGFPKQFPRGPGVGEASAFTVYGTYRCSPVQVGLDYPQEAARLTLLANEEAAVEARVWALLDDAPTTIAGGPPLITLARLEKFIGDEYGSLGVIHMSRATAAVLAVKAYIEPKGSQMLTRLGTPVIVGRGYPGTGPGIDEVQTITMGGGPATGGSFTLTFDGQTTGPIAWNATAAQVRTALIALSNVNSADVGTTGGPFPGTPVVVTFGGQYNDKNVPQMTVTNSLTKTDPAAPAAPNPPVTIAVTTGTQGGTVAAATNTEYMAASPALFGYRSQVFSGTNQRGDLLDRGTNDLFGIAERNYLIGFDPCGVAFASVDLLG